MAQGDIEVVWRPFAWQVRVQGSPVVLSTHSHKKSAIVAGRLRAAERVDSTNESVELIVKNMLGRISWRNTYGYDDPRIPG